jgi:molecular chaperone GrpE
MEFQYPGAAGREKGERRTSLFLPFPLSLPSHFSLLHSPLPTLRAGGIAFRHIDCLLWGVTLCLEYALIPDDPNGDPLPSPGDPTSLPIEVAESAPAGAPDDRLLRLAAEYDNYRKRTAREKTEAFDRGSIALVARLLDVLDDIDRLAASDPASTTADTFRGAFELIERKVRKELEAAGLERVDPVGQPFDPVLHDAVSAVAPEQDAQDHTVKATFQTGYRFKGQVIRPARVQVYSAHGVA